MTLIHFCFLTCSNIMWRMTQYSLPRGSTSALLSHVTWCQGEAPGTLVLRVLLLHKVRRPRLPWRERCGVSRVMDYQQKLAEKLVILNERGNGVLVRMNYIKKVRESSKGGFTVAWFVCNRNNKKGS